MSIIYGTAWKEKETARLVYEAIAAGFRAVDTACQPRHYREDLVGEGVARCLEKGLVKREELFLQTKYSPPDAQDATSIPYDSRASIPNQVKESIAVSLKNLRTSYLDSVVIHSPLSSFEKTIAAWQTLESFVDSGVVRQIGISNQYSLNDFRHLFHTARIKPKVLQNRFYADTGYDKELRAFCLDNGVAYQSFWTLTANPHLLSSAPLRAVAARRNLTVEEALYRFVMDLGITPLCGTTNASRMKRDVAVPSVLPLDAEERAACEALLTARRSKDRHL